LEKASVPNVQVALHETIFGGLCKSLESFAQPKEKHCLKRKFIDFS